MSSHTYFRSFFPVSEADGFLDSSFSGSVRLNIDPYSEHDDAVLLAALKSSGLTGLQAASSGDGTTTPGGHAINLDTPITVSSDPIRFLLRFVRESSR